MTPEGMLDELGIPFKRAGTHHHVATGWLGVDCPRCSPGSGRYRLGYNIAGGYFSCWVCGYLPTTQTLTELSRKSLREVYLLFKQVPSIGVVREAPTKGKLELPLGLGSLLKPHKDYLRGRGFDPDTLTSLWKLQGINHKGGTLSWRVFIPINLRGVTQSWTTRAIVNKEGTSRYKNALPSQEAYPRRELLYGLDHVRHGVIIHEGPADVWRTGVGAVALMGLSYSRGQLNSLIRFPVRVVCLDATPDAQRRARRLCEDLGAFPGTTHRIELDSKDAGEATDREIRLLRRIIK